MDAGWQGSGVAVGWGEGEGGRVAASLLWMAGVTSSIPSSTGEVRSTAGSWLAPRWDVEDARDRNNPRAVKSKAHDI